MGLIWVHHQKLIADKKTDKPMQGLESTLSAEECIQLTLLKKYKILLKFAL